MSEATDDGAKEVPEGSFDARRAEADIVRAAPRTGEASAPIITPGAALTRRSVIAGMGSALGASATATLLPQRALALMPARAAPEPPVPSAAPGVTIEDAFRLRLPESYGEGVLEDRVARAHWTRLRRILTPHLPPEHAARRWTPGDLVADTTLREAVRGAYAWAERECHRVVTAYAPDEHERQLTYIARPWPRVPYSQHEATPHFDPLNEDYVASAYRCHRCWGRLLHPVERPMRALATLLIALDLPVPDDLADELLQSLAEEIACTLAADDYSAWNAWTVRAGCLRVFGALIDRDARHPLAHAFAHPAPTGPVDASGAALWAMGDDRDLDGFMLTPLGPLDPSRRLKTDLAAPSLSARTCLGPEPRPRPTLVVHRRDLRHASYNDPTGPDIYWPLGMPHTLIALDGPSERVGHRTWGPPLTPDDAARAAAFVARNRDALIDHWDWRTDSLGVCEAIVNDGAAS